MNCAWKNKTKQNKNDSKAEMSFYVFTQMTLGDDRMKIQADVTHVNGANCVSHCTVCVWIAELRAEKKSASKNITVQIV